MQENTTQNDQNATLVQDENNHDIQHTAQVSGTPVSDDTPHLPGGWAELTWDQLLWTWKLLGSERPLHEAYIDMFQCYMQCHLDTTDQGVDPDSGELIYYFIADNYTLADDDGNPQPVRFSITPADLYIMCQEDLKWMQEDPYCIIELPTDTLDHGDLTWDVSVPNAETGRAEEQTVRFHVPEALINNITWQQYQLCQQLMQAMQQDDSFRSRFISHCLTPCTSRKYTTTGQVLYEYKYDPVVAEANIPFFEQHPMPGLAEVLIQLFQSSLKHYKTEFTHLFSSSGGGDGPDKSEFIQEISTINSIVKWSNMFHTPEAVLEANVPIIFDILDKMQNEARQIEEMNAKMKRKH